LSFGPVGDELIVVYSSIIPWNREAENKTSLIELCTKY